MAGCLAACGGSVVDSDRVNAGGAPPAWTAQSATDALVLEEGSAGRPATQADLAEAAGWFGPGELAAVLAISNRAALARGADTIPHCMPLCGLGAPSLARPER